MALKVCPICKKVLHHLGYARHRTMHYEKDMAPCSSRTIKYCRTECKAFRKICLFMKMKRSQK